MRGTCKICGKEYSDHNAGKFPFLVCEDPCLCSVCVEALEDERLEMAHSIFIKQPEIVQMIRDHAAPNFPGPGTEHIRVMYRHGAIVVGMDSESIREQIKEMVTDDEAEDKDENTQACDAQKEKEKVAVEEENEDPEYAEVITEVLRSVQEQDEAVKEIARIIFHNQRVLQCKKKYGILSKKQNAFIVGPTGTGKTMTLTKLCENLDLPYVIVDSTELTQEGYVGRDVNDIFMELIRRADGNLRKAESGIVAFDEFDKKEARDNGVGQDISGKCVLDSLLKAVESKEIILKSGDVFDTTGVTFFALGVYPKLKQIRENRLKGKKSMGFKNEPEAKEVEGKYLWSDLEQHGVTKELCGRFPCIIEFSDFTREGYRNILLHSDDSEWKCQKELFEIFYGLELEINGEGIDYVIDKAKSFGIGARGLNAVVTSLLADVEKDVLSGRMKHKRIVFGKEGRVVYCD